MLVAKWEPAPCYHDAYLVGFPKGGIWGGRAGKGHCKTTVSPRGTRVFLVSKRTLYLFLGEVVWMLHIGRARHPGPGRRSFTPGQLSIEFANIGGWLTLRGFGCGFLCSVSCCRWVFDSY